MMNFVQAMGVVAKGKGDGIVVATMGVAAGINFSLRSVALAGDSYRRDGIEQPIAGDEILQMFGRAGRRGSSDCSLHLSTTSTPKLSDARTL